MKKISLAILTAAVSVMACAPKATEEDCRNACNNLARLQESLRPAAAAVDPVLGINQEFDNKTQELQNQQTQTLQALDKEMQAALAKAKKNQKAKLTEEYQNKKKSKQGEFASKLQDLGAQKSVAIKAAEEAKAKLQQEAKLTAEKALQECTESCTREGAKKGKADCQAQATDLDAFNQCK